MKKFNVKVNGKTYAVEVEEVGGFTYQPVQQEAPMQQAAVTAQAQAAPEPEKTSEPEPVPAPKAPSGPASGETISAPMPGTILDVRVTEGQSIKAGDILFILEAMKMENEIVSPKNGTINKIYTSKSTNVNTGDPLVTIE
ncbi:MAG TPA: acetyl-CoA carboxylase biotin carboxyl carrier protein subunit [Lactobacillus acetotolerans]|nr:acetyl-CoA carboxylase biotin carboxyl carrier protein subunit [Lactobacillus acetotolerans]